jgi:hypothetical protein
VWLVTVIVGEICVLCCEMGNSKCGEKYLYYVVKCGTECVGVNICIVL